MFTEGPSACIVYFQHFAEAFILDLIDNFENDGSLKRLYTLAAYQQGFIVFFTNQVTYLILAESIIPLDFLAQLTGILFKGQFSSEFSQSIHCRIFGQLAADKGQIVFGYQGGFVDLVHFLHFTVQ